MQHWTKVPPHWLVVACCLVVTHRAAALCPLRGGAAEPNFASSVAYPGDLDGDGFGDIAVGASGQASSAGRVYIYRGGPGYDAAADIVLVGKAAGDRFGAAVAAAGDVNDDGFPDLAIGAPGEDLPGWVDAGRVHVYFGGPGFDSDSDWDLGGTIGGMEFGTAVAGGGDLNGDGRMDLAVGAPRANFGSTGAGGVFVFFGATPLPTTPARILFTGAPGERFGTSVAIGTTLDLDPAADLVVGAPEYQSPPGSRRGRIAMYWGSPAFDTLADRFINGLADMHLGTTLAVGDVNGDDYPDVIGGALGGARVYYQGPAGDSESDLDLAPTGTAFVGFVAAGFDVNGDGEGDFASGAAGVNVSPPKVWLYHGGPNVDDVPEADWTGHQSSPFGKTGAMGPDLDGDGLAELAIGTPEFSVDLRPGACIAVHPFNPETFVVMPEQVVQIRFYFTSCASVPVPVVASRTDVLGWTAMPDEPLVLSNGSYWYYQFIAPKDACGQTNRFDLIIRQPDCPSVSVSSIYVSVTANCTPTDVDPAPGTGIATTPAWTSLHTVAATGSQTLVRYDVAPGTRALRLEIFDIAGRRRRVLTSAVPAAGRHEIHWDHRDADGVPVARGVYVVRLVADEVNDSRKVVVATR